MVNYDSEAEAEDNSHSNRGYGMITKETGWEPKLDLGVGPVSCSILLINLSLASPSSISPPRTPSDDSLLSRHFNNKSPSTFKGCSVNLQLCLDWLIVYCVRAIQWKQLVC